MKVYCFIFKMRVCIRECYYFELNVFKGFFVILLLILRFMLLNIC